MEIPEPGGKTRKDKKSRGEHLRDSKQPPPNLAVGEYGRHLLECCADLGWYDIVGEGDKKVVSFSEIEAYRQTTAKINEPWECVLVAKMSKGFISGSIMGASPYSLHPFELEY